MIIIIPQLTSSTKSVSSIPIQKMDVSSNTIAKYAEYVNKPKPEQKSCNKKQKSSNNSNFLDKMDPVSANIMLDSYYIPAKETVPENYPRKAIGDCPYTKHQSTDLPLANVSLCGINKGKPMRMSEW